MIVINTLFWLAVNVLADQNIYTETKYPFKCKLNDHIQTSPTGMDMPVYIAMSVGDALQQTISRIYAIVLHQVYGFQMVQLMQEIYSPFNEMTSEMDRVDEQLVQLQNRSAEGGRCFVFKLGIHRVVAYPYTEKLRAIKYVGSLGINTRYEWFLPQRNDTLPRRQLPMDAFKHSNFVTIKQHFHHNVTQLEHKLQITLNNTRTFVPSHCNESNCAIMLAGRYADTAFIVEHIRLLNVSVQVLWLDDQLFQIKRRLLSDHTASKLFLFLARTPSEIVGNATDYRTVAMPLAGGPLSQMQASVYDWTPMEKYSSLSVLQSYVDALHFETHVDGLLANVTRMLEHTNGNTSNETIYDQVACDWLNQADAEDRKMLGIDKWSGKKIMHIGYIFFSSTTRIAAEMAIEAIKALNPPLLNNVQLSLTPYGASTPLRSYIQLTNANLPLGMIGPDVKQINYIADTMRVPMISYSAGNGAEDGNIDAEFPFSFRTIADRKQFEQVYVELFQKFGWRRVALLSDSDKSHQLYIAQLSGCLKNSSMEVESRHIPHNASSQDIIVILSTLRQLEYRIFITDFDNDVAVRVLCEAFHLQMTADQKHVWFLSPKMAEFDTSTPGFKISRCSAADLDKSLNATLALYAAPFAANASVLHKGSLWSNVSEWRTELYRRSGSNARNDELPSYAGFAYDAVWLLAMALKVVMIDRNTTIDTSDTTMAKLSTALKHTNLPDGVSGHVRFDDRTSRVSDIYVGQRSSPDQWRIVYKFLVNQSVSPLSGTLHCEKDNNVCLWPREIITDGTARCHLHTLSTWLGIKCDNAILIVYTLFAVICTVCVVTAMYVFWEHRYKMRMESEAKMLRSFGIDLVSKQVDETRLDKSEIARNRIVLNRRLGGGQFGTVYFGQLRNAEDRSEQVAVKTPENPNNFNMRLEFLSEAQAMRHFEHPNIVRLIGVSLLADPMYIVMEYMLLGDLNMYLLSRRTQVTADTQDLWSRRLTGFALDLSRGLSYMAELRYVHRDIACRNCLLTGAGERITAKLADFGMSRPVYGNDVYQFRRRGALPVRWSAPESMQNGTYSPASDVWSFGVLLWEMVTLGAYPYHEVCDDQVLLALVRSGRTLTIPAQANEDLRWLIGECWQLNAKKRMRACEIVDFVSGRATVVAPCVADGEEFEQIYALNNEPDGRQGRAREKLRRPMVLSDDIPGELNDEMASVQTLRNDLSQTDEPDRVFNNCNYASGVRPDAGYKAYPSSMGTDAERPLLRETVRTWRRTAYRTWCVWTKPLWLWQRRPADEL